MPLIIWNKYILFIIIYKVINFLYRLKYNIYTSIICIRMSRLIQKPRFIHGGNLFEYSYFFTPETKIIAAGLTTHEIVSKKFA